MVEVGLHLDVPTVKKVNFGKGVKVMVKVSYYMDVPTRVMVKVGQIWVYLQSKVNSSQGVRVMVEFV